MSIGDQIKESRIARSWTQAELAEESGISLRTIQRLESGQSSPSLYTLRKVQAALGIQISGSISETSQIYPSTKISRKMQTVITYIAGTVLGLGAMIAGFSGIFSKNYSDDLVGSTSLISVETVNCDSESSCDILVIVKDDQGEVLWQKIVGGSSYDKASSAIPTFDGGFLVLGSTSSFGQGNYDILLVKLTNDGEFLWQKTYGGFFNDYAQEITNSASGNGFLIKGSKQTCSTPNVSSDCQMSSWEFEIDISGELVG